MGLKSFVFSLLPTKVQRSYILKKTGYRLISDAKLTDSLQAAICIPPGKDLWVNRMSKPYGHEPQVVKWFERNLNGDDSVYDIGSNFGFYGVLALGLKPTSKFYGFEAGWFINGFQILNRERSASKDNWVCIEKMVGDKDSGDFVSIDGSVKKMTKPSVVLMDVDGEEHLVLKGAKDLLKNASATWLVEVHPKDLAKRNKSQTEIIAAFDQDLYHLRYLPNLRNASSEWKDSIEKQELEEEFFLLATPKTNPRF